MFLSTKDNTSENRKAELKNHNLPILQYMYHGSSAEPLRCVFIGRPAFTQFDCIVKNTTLTRFSIDFNHIRQHQTGNRAAGVSLDKGRYGPSDIFRMRYLDDTRYTRDLVEFMAMMPVNVEYHTYINQSSAYGDITLNNYKQEWRPWVLQSKDNFDAFTKDLNIA